MSFRASGTPSSRRVQITRRRPAYLFFVVDQSYSMRQEMEGIEGLSKAGFVARAINQTFTNLIVQCTRSRGSEMEVESYFDISVLGYGNPDVSYILEGPLAHQPVVSLAELAAHPHGHEKRSHSSLDASGVHQTVTTEQPVWITPGYKGGTPTYEALDKVREQIERWIDDHQESYPPIVLHITDGRYTTGDPLPVAQAIQELRTEHGPVQLLNCHISRHQHAPIRFPVEVGQLRLPPMADAAQRQAAQEFAEALFAMSSVLRDDLVEMARELEYDDVKPGARGYIYNAGVPDLVAFLNIGTVHTLNPTGARAADAPRRLQTDQLLDL